jgi:hypothetical protein
MGELRVWTTATNGPIVIPPDVSMENHGGMVLAADTIDLSVRALWQSYL